MIVATENSGNNAKAIGKLVQSAKQLTPSPTSHSLFPLWVGLTTLVIVSSAFVLIGSYLFRKSTI